MSVKSKRVGLCAGKTAKGCPCSKKVKINQTHCHLHKDQIVVEKPFSKEKTPSKEKAPSKDKNKNINTECPICFSEVSEKEAKKTRLNCGHVHCLTCIKSLRQLSCSICRAPLKGNLSKKIIADIATNIKKDKAEEELQQRNELIRRYGTDDIDINFHNTLIYIQGQIHRQPDRRMELLGALATMIRY